MILQCSRNPIASPSLGWAIFHSRLCYTFPMKKRDKIALGIFGIFYISIGAMLALFQNQVVYHPNSEDFTACPNFTEAEKVTANGTRLYVHETEKPLVVFYHGNAGSACDRKHYADIFTAAGYGYIIVEYTGFSNDPHTPTHESVKADVRNVIDYLAENHLTHITVIGESIGTGIASYHASLVTPEKLLLISPFSSLGDIASHRFWFYPTSLLVDNAFDNVALLADYQNPIMIIHGDNDGTIPYRLGQKLFSSLQTKKQFVTIAGGGHNNLFDYDETYTAITKFLIAEK